VDSSTNRIASPGTPRFNRSRTVRKLPRLFDIFLPSTSSIPLCIQMFANAASGWAQADCAISFS